MRWSVVAAVLLLTLVSAAVGAQNTDSRPLTSESLGVNSSSAPRAVTPPGSYSLSIDGDFELGGFVFKDGYPFLHNDGTYNTALGENALRATTSGSANTALGENALRATDSGWANTATGYGALVQNMSGYNNTASGAYALFNNTTGIENTACGGGALWFNTEGSHNTAVGYSALLRNTMGSNNIALGFGAGFSLGFVDPQTGASTYSNNIFVGNQGQVPDENLIRIGTQSVHTETYVAGIFGNTTVGSNYVNVTSSGQLVQGAALTVSSRRFKENIEEMGDSSSRLLQLRPVTFRFKEAFQPADRSRQFGLIAEEVAQVIPELVRYDEDGRPSTVRYLQLSSMLLNELQKQRRQNQLQWWLMGVMLLTGIGATIGRWQFG